MSTRRRQEILVFVRPSTRDKVHPLTAYIGGTQLEGTGHTVVEAIEDLFTSKGAGTIAQQLEQLVGEAGWVRDLSTPA